MITEATIQSIIDSLRAGKTPQVDPEDIPCFSAEALVNSPVIRQEHLAQILENLTEDDIPALERAITSLRLNDQAWIGFKIVTDPEACMRPDDQSFDMGPSEDDVSTLFFANEGKDIVASRPWNKRDRKQMLDVTRGPSMHVDQFEGVTWCSVPLFTTQRVVLYGAGEVSVFLARYADDCGFTSLVIDDDEAFLTEERFPLSERVFVDADWSNLDDVVTLDEDDYCCVVTRGHVHDTDALVHAVKSDAFYVGMMGNPGKNAGVIDDSVARGCSREDFERIHAPIGVAIADKTPAEIAISIIAELIDVRGKARKETAAQVAEMIAAGKD
ncbi:MAG: XdhC family protein [Coriobacteriaceae bacterium]|nr:XdhC family protein [Coriobacteriaceae bacterium]